MASSTTSNPLVAKLQQQRHMATNPSMSQQTYRSIGNPIITSSTKNLGLLSANMATNHSSGGMTHKNPSVLMPAMMMNHSSSSQVNPMTLQTRTLTPTYHHSPTSTTVPTMQMGNATLTNPSYYTFDDPQLYSPPNAEYIAPGRSLRAGMHPIYDMHDVRTFEAFPVYHSAPMIQETERGGSAPSMSMEQVVPKSHTASKSPSKRKSLCC